MKKTLAIVSLLGISLAAPILAQAADGADYESKGQITFIPNTDPTNPVSPTDPDPDKPIRPVDPTDPENPDAINPGTQGPLSIDFASTLYFGEQKISSRTEVYHAESQKYVDADGESQEGPNFVQVTDNRGTESGWTLKVRQDGQFKTDAGQVLEAAEIRFINGEIVTPSDSPEPTVLKEEITLDPEGAESLVMSAQAGEGAGTYLTRWGKDMEEAVKSIELEVPGSTTKYATQYTTTFTWLLTDTPTNP